MTGMLAIDQGGTKTLAAFCTEKGEILALGSDAGYAALDRSAIEDIQMMRVAMAVDALISQLRHTMQAQYEDLKIIAIDVGFSGADWDFEYPLIADRLQKTFAASPLLKDCPVHLVNDCIGALRGGTAQTPSVAVCVGTGMNIATIKNDSDRYIYGFGILDRDQGASGLGKDTLDAVFAAESGMGAQTALTAEVLAYTGFTRVEDLMIHWTVKGLSLEPKTLVPILLKCAVSGDAVALEIVHDFSERTARYVLAGLRRLSLIEADLPIVFSGSVLKDIGQIIVDQTMYYVHQEAAQAKTVQAVYEPVCGLLLLGLDRQYGVVPENVMADFYDSAALLGLLRTGGK